MMKKIIKKEFIFIFLIFAVFCAAELTQATPAGAASAKSPFMDVPEGSWVYDAVARLASRGIISGYPDGLYKGRQTITRYEAASMAARAMAYFDKRRADVQDMETLKKLAAEFRDELDALGLRTDALDNDMAAFRERVGGWRFSGRIRTDLDRRNTENMDISVPGSESMGNLGFGDARLNMERWYGEKNNAYFLAQIRADSGDDSTSPFRLHYFYSKIPFYFGSFITAGIAGGGSLDARFAYETPGTGRYSTWGWFDGAPLPMIRLDVDFVIFNFTAYVAHGKIDGSGGTKFNNGIWEQYSPDAWNIFTNIDIKLNQYLGFGLGAQYLIHDDWDISGTSNRGQGKAWSDIFTAWFGADYNIFNVAAAHGIIYYQRTDTDDNFWGSGSVTDRPDGGTAWRLALDFNQDVLKLTSLYAEYMQVPSGFFALDGIDNNVLLGDAEHDEVSFFGSVANHDLSMWKIGANQRWSDKLSTWLFYADVNANSSAGYSDLDAGLRQYGLGIEYAYSDNVMLGLNYLKWDGKDSWSDKNYSRVRFTTQVTF